MRPQRRACISPRRAGDADEAVDVDVAHAIHLGEIEIGQVALAEHAGVVDQDIDGAESLARGFHEPGAIGGAGQVACDGDGTAAGLFDQLHDLFGLVAALAVVDPYGNPITSEAKSDGAANATGGAGNQSDSSGRHHCDQSRKLGSLSTIQRVIASNIMRFSPPLRAVRENCPVALTASSSRGMITLAPPASAAI